MIEGNGKAVSAYAKLLQEVQDEFPAFEIVEKADSTLMKVLDVLLRVITFGIMRTFMTQFSTMVGNTLYVSKGWTERPTLERAASLRHERVHLRQQKRYGRLLFTVRYMCWPLPAIFAIGRRDIEQEAYAESLRAYVEYYGPRVLEDKNYRDRIINHFVSANYFWTFPFKKQLQMWYDDLASDIRAEIAT